MKIFNIIALLPSLSVAEPAVDHFNNVNAHVKLAKRVACNTQNWIKGLQLIENSMDALKGAILVNPAAYPPCAKVNNLAAIVNSAQALSGRIIAERNAIAACEGPAQYCASPHLEVTNSINPRATQLSNILVARSGQIACNALGGVVTGQAKSILGAINSYATAVKDKVTPGCYNTVTSDVSTLINVIVGMLRSIQ